MPLWPWPSDEGVTSEEVPDDVGGSWYGWAAALVAGRDDRLVAARG